MRKSILFLICMISLFLIPTVKAVNVVNDSFSDCNYNSNPIWSIISGSYSIDSCIWLYNKSTGNAYNTIYTAFNTISIIDTSWEYLVRFNGSASSNQPRSQFALWNTTPNGQFNCINEGGNGGYLLDIEAGIGDYSLFRCGIDGIYTNLLTNYQNYNFLLNNGTYNITLVRNSTTWSVYINDTLNATASDTDNITVNRLSLYSVTGTGGSSNSIGYTNILGITTENITSPLCIDSDDNDIYTYGNCVDSNGTVYDSCGVNNYVNEQICTDLGGVVPLQCGVASQKCSEGSTCHNGVCSNASRMYYSSQNCTVTTDEPFGSLACSVSIPIPNDCTDIQTTAYTTLITEDEGNFNSSVYYTRWACNPSEPIPDTCTRVHDVCNYENFNLPVVKDYNNYGNGTNASSYHLGIINEGCMVNPSANFSLIGRLELSCLSKTTYGINIDNAAKDCVHEIKCYSDKKMVEIFTDCKVKLINCIEGEKCQSGSCSPMTEQEKIKEEVDTPFYDLGVFSFFTSPIFICFGIMLGCSTFITYKVNSKAKISSSPTIFLGCIIGFSVMFTYFGVFPIWIGILLVVFSGILIATELRKMMG